MFDLVQFVPPEDPIKISRLTLRNDSGRTRRISVTAYVEWVLGSSRSASAPYIVTELDPHSRAIFARSAWNGEFGGRIASRIWPDAKLLSPATAPNFSAATELQSIPRRWNEARHFPERWAPASILAPRCKPCSNCARRARRNRIFPRPDGEPRTSARVAESLSHRRSRQSFLPKSRGNGTTSSAPSRSPHPIPAWTCC